MDTWEIRTVSFRILAEDFKQSIHGMRHILRERVETFEGTLSKKLNLNEPETKKE
jgi:hypothetical protein